MSFQEQSISVKTKDDAPDRLREFSLLGLAANLDDPLCHQKLSTLFEKLNLKGPHAHHDGEPS
jgi:hypothetical protein